MSKKLLILCQIGSPQEPTPEAVGEYLRKFLMDEKVLSLPYALRWFLVNGIIVPRRKKTSAAKYKKIWTVQGSPLTSKTAQFFTKLKQELPASQWDIALHFVYGPDTPEQTLEPYRQQHYEQALLAPLFPQYAEATTGSVTHAWAPVLKKLFPQTEKKVLAPFYDQAEWIHAWQERLQQRARPEAHILFSYHGLPESQIRQVAGCQLNEKCCERPNIGKCYLAQCRKSTEMIARGMNLTRYSMSFQSRLGRAKWLGPATEDEVQRLAAEGQKALTVICPAFVVDGLETLEEVNIEVREKFLAAGGEHFELLPSLNDELSWVAGFGQLLQRAKSWQPFDFTSL
jgi:ferrochelatase